MGVDVGRIYLDELLDIEGVKRSAQFHGHLNWPLTDRFHLMFLQVKIKGSSTRNDLGLGLGIWELLLFAHDEIYIYIIYIF